MGHARTARIFSIALCLAFSILVVGTATAQQAAGTLHKIDVEAMQIHLNAAGQDRVVALAPDVKVLGEDGQPLPEGLRSSALVEGAQVTITRQRGTAGPVITAIQLGGSRDTGRPLPEMRTQLEPKPSVGFVPLDEMTADQRYKGEDGGLYGGGSNEIPAALLDAAKKATAQVVPRDAAGSPAPDGKIGLVSISMSNATQEYSRFKQIADADPRKSPNVAVVDCAQGGQAMAEWVDPEAQPWQVAMERLAAANVSPAQVQVIWVKLANKNPSGDLAEHGQKLKDDTAKLLQNAKTRFPNLQIAYLGSRIYAGYAGGPLNPEPYAYESAFVVRWLIQDQISGEKGGVRAGDAGLPLLLWGPYFWADGMTPRKGDGLFYTREDLAGDGTHPSESGRQKVAEQLLKFFTTDPLASTWFVGK